MRTGVIDCGTNTFNLLIAERDEKQWTPLFNNRINVRLGKGGIAQGLIRNDRMARGIDALLSHREALLNYNADEVVVIATAAVRDASNVAEFIRAVKSATGFEVRVVDGMKEAELIFHGVAQSVSLGDDNVIVMDIGGGSTEFIIGIRQGICWKQSFPLGVARLFEFLAPSDPITSEQLEKLEQALHKALEPLSIALERFPATRLIGASGSFDTLVAMIAARQNARPNQQSNKIALDQFEDMRQLMLQSTFEERVRIPGMLPLRADTLPLAAALINFVIKQFSITEMEQSAYALKEGVMAQVMEQRLKPQAMNTVMDSRHTA